ncbi:hypothetical protein [Fluviibacterium sp. S390]|uniref:hypothetical protein n=1 Tax=Fluviibacterium sp. S390 TaxID=3415139 RepID=UPI003C7B6E38
MTLARLYRLFAALILAAGLSACGPPQPDLGASVGPGGAGAHAGVQSGRVSAGVSTSGTYAAVDVVQTDKVDVTVGTHGAGASVRVGNSPVRIGLGTGGLRLGI